MRLRPTLLFLIFMLVFFPSDARAQQKGQYLPGQSGLNAGVLPDPGFSYVNMSINYSSDTLKNGSGSTIPLSSSYNVWAIENIVFFVSKFKLLRGKFAAMVVITPANGSLTLGSLAFPNVTLNAGGFGLADTWAQPATLGWTLKRADVYVGYGLVAPTGRYTPGASDNVGGGYWGNHFLTGSTFYLTKNKGTTANLFTDWEFHGSKQTGLGTRLTPGEAFTIEWGLGQAIPLDRQFHKLLQLGAIGYDQWQVSDNTGVVAPIIPARLLPFYSVHAAGFQANFVLPPRNLNFFFKFEDEYRAFARPQGQTIVFGGSYTFRIPKPKPAAAP